MAANPDAVKVFAPAKINLFLHIGERRADGYHDLESLVAFADVGDALLFEDADSLSLTVDGPFGAALTGFWSDERGTNLLDSGAPFYDCYVCADGGYVAVAAIEPQFYAALLDGLGLDPAELPDQNDQARWPELRDVIGSVLLTRDRDEWAARFEHAGACVASTLIEK